MKWFLASHNRTCQDEVYVLGLEKNILSLTNSLLCELLFLQSFQEGLIKEFIDSLQQDKQLCKVYKNNINEYLEYKQVVNGLKEKIILSVKQDELFKAVHKKSDLTARLIYTKHVNALEQINDSDLTKSLYVDKLIMSEGLFKQEQGGLASKIACSLLKTIVGEKIGLFNDNKGLRKIYNSIQWSKPVEYNLLNGYPSDQIKNSLELPDCCPV